MKMKHEGSGCKVPGSRCRVGLPLAGARCVCERQRERGRDSEGEKGRDRERASERELLGAVHDTASEREADIERERARGGYLARYTTPLAKVHCPSPCSLCSAHPPSYLHARPRLIG